VRCPLTTLRAGDTVDRTASQQSAAHKGLLCLRPIASPVPVEPAQIEPYRRICTRELVGAEGQLAPTPRSSMSPLARYWTWPGNTTPAEFRRARRPLRLPRRQCTFEVLIHEHDLVGDPTLVRATTGS
jgi:hypothetical protein